MDVGQPPDYLTGMTLYLDSLQKASSPLLAKAEDHKDFELVGPVIIVRGTQCLSCTGTRGSAVPVPAGDVVWLRLSLTCRAS